jgi:hypothetical protein
MNFHLRILHLKMIIMRFNSKSYTPPNTFYVGNRIAASILCISGADPVPDPLIRRTNPDPAPDSSIIKQIIKKKP